MNKMNNKVFFLIFFVTTSLSAGLTISDLTLDQKIGQLFMVAAVADEELAYDTVNKKPYRLDKDYIEELIREYHIGGVIFLGKSDVQKQIDRTQYFQTISQIPLLIGQDIEPGRVGKARFDFLSYPNNQELGNIDNQNYTFAIAKAIGGFCKTLGVNINFAPVADINSNPNNPVINDRSFGSDREAVAYQCLAFMTGLDEMGIISCAKHFPGHGDTTTDSHRTLPCIEHTRERLDAIELFPFTVLIQYKVPAIMVGHIAVTALDNKKTPASLSRKVVTDLLRDELNFTGLIITDALDMKAVTKHYKDGNAELQALLAGNDILLSPVSVPKAVEAIKNALQEGMVTEETIDTHVERILTVKNSLLNEAN